MGPGIAKALRLCVLASVAGSMLVLQGCGGDDSATTEKPKPSKGPFGDRSEVTDITLLAGLGARADAVRDEYGTVHIYARSEEDAFRVQGFMAASDRMGQMEILRRVATGRLAELFGAASPASIDSDITMRTVGLARVAKQVYEELDPSSPERKMLDAFADGVTQWIQGCRAGKLSLPAELLGLTPQVLDDWSPVDSLAVMRYELYTQSYTAATDIRLTDRRDKLAAKFDPGSVDPLLAKRSGILLDVLRFDDSEPASPMTGFPDSSSASGSSQQSAPPSGSKASNGAAQASPQSRKLRARALGAARGFADAVERTRGMLGPVGASGSNNWAMAGSTTANGNALLASDPHLTLNSPTIWWPTHVVVQSDDSLAPELEFSGVSLPGLPGIVAGTNRHVALGPTNAMYDVTDVWMETLSGTDGVMFKGQTVPFQKISETIKINGSPDYTWDVLVVPHHGPVAPTLKDHRVAPLNAGDPVLSVRWTGDQPTREIYAAFGVLHANTVADAEIALRDFEFGALNWMLADSNGDIGLTVHAKLPYRDKRAFTWDPKTFSGTLPCFELDGASGEQEWTGQYLEEQYIPKIMNPAKGWLATANTDPIGSTSDNDPSNSVLPSGQPFYVGADFMLAMRLGRIEERVKDAVGSATAQHMSEIQNDHQSYLGRRLARYLVTALKTAEDEKSSPGTHADLTTLVQSSAYAAANVPDLVDTLDKWGKEADYDTPSGVSLDDGSLDPDPVHALASKAMAIYAAWQLRVFTRVLYDELDAAGLGEGLWTGNSMWGQPWFRHLLESDPTQLATYDATTGDSALWDDLTTPEVESRNETMVAAALDAVNDLETALGADHSAWRWGKLHRLTFKTLVPLWLITNPSPKDALFPQGYPRSGDFQSVDTGDYVPWQKPSSTLDFSYTMGPTQRLVVELTPSGPKIQNALPGGAVMDPKSPYFDNEAKLWLRNQTHDVPFEIDNVAAAIPAGGQHIEFTP